MDISSLSGNEIQALEKQLSQRKRQLRVAERRAPRLQTKRKKLLAEIKAIDQQIQQAQTGNVTPRQRRQYRRRRPVETVVAS